jgi:arylsulfatase A-like enzyme
MPLTESLAQNGYKVAAVGSIDDIQPEWLSMANVRQSCPSWTSPQSESGLLHFDDFAHSLRYNYLDALEAQDVSVEEAFVSDVLHPVHWTGSQAVRYVQQTGEPFFLWVSFSGTARDAVLPPARLGMYDPGQVRPPDDWPFAEDADAMRDEWPRWMGWLSFVDYQIGRILATLAARGRTNNRIIVTSFGGHPGVQPFHHDLAIRVPMLLAGMTGQRRGQRDLALASLEDVFPTLLEWAGLSPADERANGASLVPRLMDSGGIHRAVACSSPVPGLAVARGERYKLVHGTDGRKALYDLQNDPGETQNLHGRLMVFRACAQLEESLAAWKALQDCRTP